MKRVALRVRADVFGPGSAVAAKDALRHSTHELGVLIAEPLTTEWTDLDADGVQSLTERWVIARAILVETP